MAAFAAFSTQDALHTLSTSIPDWNSRLDELNGQIALRQLELARLVENNPPPPARSIRNKGSTESLRPQDGDEPQVDAELTNPFATPEKPDHNGTSSSSSAALRSALVVTPPLSKQRPSPAELSRKPSVNTPPMASRFGLRKRKTESVASAESQAPKYRTRSMIIVYYDSAVQTAFEDLVKFVSASRNSMRKGKMNAKMEAMRLAAEQETEEDTEVDSMQGLSTSTSGTPTTQGSTASGTPGQEVVAGGVIALEAGNDDDDEEIILPPLKFVSTRNMGPPGSGRANERGGLGHGAGGIVPGLMARGPRTSMRSLDVNDIFDELDKGLEWCQSQCERAAHQFLRDGDCSDEIEGIKKRLLSIKEKSEAEVERLKKEEAEKPLRQTRETGKSRELRRPQMRKTIGAIKAAEQSKEAADAAAAAKKAATSADNSKLEVDKMEVDEDEGYEEIDLPSMMAFRRTRDMGR